MCSGWMTYKATFDRTNDQCSGLCFLPFHPPSSDGFLNGFHSQVSPIIAADFRKLLLQMRSTLTFKGKKKQNKCFVSDSSE